MKRTARALLFVPLLLALSAGPALAAPRPTKSISIAAVGDTMLGTTPQLPGNPYRYLGAVRSQLRADLVFGNLEGTLTNASFATKCGGSSGGNCFAFRAPPRFARSLAATGFTVMSNANNHFGDFGAQGEEETVAALRRAGIASTGRPGEIAVRRVDGTKVAVLGFAPYGNTAPLLDPGAARALIRKAARLAPIVVVAFHAGAEGTGAQHLGGEEHYLGEDRGNPRRFGRMAVRNGADLILGSGPHVLRGAEIYRGRLLAYSLGNFCGFHNFDVSGVLGASAILHANLGPQGALRGGSFASVRMVGPGRPTPDRSGEGARLVARLSRADLGRTAVKLGGRGRILLPGR